MEEIDCVRDHYSSKDYYKVIDDLDGLPEDSLDEWSFVFLANSYLNLCMFDECLETIGRFKERFPDSMKLRNVENILLDKEVVYTIGYSSFPPNSESNVDVFIEQLRRNEIRSLIDVRTIPSSRAFPMFNGEHLVERLADAGIDYISMKKEFGARRSEDIVYTELPTDLLSRLSWGKKIDDHGKMTGYVDFERVYGLRTFVDGFDRCKELLKKGRICFMCSETHPWDCHRTIMVSEYFRRNGYFVRHIVGPEVISQKECNIALKRFFIDSSTEYTNSTRQRTLSMFEGGMKNDRWDSFFKDFTLEKAIELKNIQIGYKRC